jgi:hypothetical protein
LKIISTCIILSVLLSGCNLFDKPNKKSRPNSNKINKPIENDTQIELIKDKEKENLKEKINKEELLDIEKPIIESEDIIKIESNNTIVENNIEINFESNETILNEDNKTIEEESNETIIVNISNKKPNLNEVDNNNIKENNNIKDIEEKSKDNIFEEDLVLDNEISEEIMIPKQDILPIVPITSTPSTKPIVNIVPKQDILPIAPIPEQPVAKKVLTNEIITNEVTNFFNKENRLPILAHYNSGEVGVNIGMTPEYIISLIEEQNITILPTWRLNPFHEFQIEDEYYKESILKAKELNLPLTFIINPLENSITDSYYYINKKYELNLNVIGKDGRVINKISPFGKTELWNELGEKSTNLYLFHKLQEWYPNPPKVIFINNEKSNRMLFEDLNQSKKYIEEYNSNIKEEEVEEIWKDKYNELNEGFVNKLIVEEENNPWKQSKIISFDDFSLDIKNSWIKDSNLTNNYFSLLSNISDSTIINCEINNTIESRNKFIFDLNNLSFIKSKTNENFNYQLSINDNNSFNTSEEYEGFSKLIIWLSKSNLILEKNTNHDRNTIMEHYTPIIDIVKNIHSNKILKEFWLNSFLIENKDMKEEKENYDLNWYLLKSSMDIDFPWNKEDNIKVFSFAMIKPNGEKLIYAYSPYEDIDNVIVEIPNYGDIDINVTTKGNFYYINNEEEIQKIEN